MSDEMFKELEIVMTDRISNALDKNDEYKQALSKEFEVFEQLKSELTKQQQNQLDEYFTLSNSTAVVCGKIAYRQGMEDLASILDIGHR